MTTIAVQIKSYSDTFGVIKQSAVFSFCKVFVALFSNIFDHFFSSSDALSATHAGTTGRWYPIDYRNNRELVPNLLQRKKHARGGGST